MTGDQRASKVTTRGPDTGEPTVFIGDEQAGTSDQGKPRLDLDHWARFATDVLTALGVEGEAELSIILVDEDHMTTLNRQHMGVDGSTDVLSFPIDGIPEPSTSGLMPASQSSFDPDDLPVLLGDVVLCPAVAARQAPAHAGSFDDEVALLIVHGVLHLLGMDHLTDDERLAMQARERDLIERFHGVPALDPWS